MKLKNCLARGILIGAWVGVALRPAFCICQGGILVTEQASVKVPPDEATVVLSVESQEPDIDVAMQKNADASNRLKTYLKKEGVKSIEMDPPVVEMRYAQKFENGKAAQSLEGYTVRTTMTCLVNAVSRISVLSSGVISHGATSLVGVQLRSTQYEKARADARKLALTKAKSRAIELAQQVGQSVGLITDISEGGTMQPWSTYSALSGFRSQGGYPAMSLASLSSYGMPLSSDAAMESNKIIVSASLSVCMEFKELAAREKR